MSLTKVSYSMIQGAEFNVLDYGAVGDGITDDSVAVQAAFDAANAVGGGTVYLPSGTYLCNTPLVLQYGVNLIGESRANTKILKDSTTTKTVTIYANPLIPQIYAPSTLPNNINAILVLTGAPGPGRYTGFISEITFEGTYATPGDYESQKVEFGIVSVGSVSDFTIQNCNIKFVQYGLILPTVFVAEIKNNRVSQCLRGIGIDGGTSTSISSNYTISCRNYGYFIRSLYYSEISGNACDALNRNDWYPDRTLTCNAYVFRSCRGLTITANGQEQTLGRNWVFQDSINCVFEGNLSIGLGSDYVGTDEIAWIYSSEKLENSTFRNNASWSYNSASGLLFGGANPAQHHNIYFEGLAYVAHNIFDNNMVFNNDTGVVVEAGWLNDVPTTWVNAATGGDLLTTYAVKPTVRAEIQGDLSITYLTGNNHYQHQIGKVVHVWGCFHMSLTYTTASRYMIFDGFPYNNSVYWNIAVTGIEIATPLAKQLGSIVINATSNGGIGKTPLGDVFNITDIPSGSTIRIFYDGWYQRET